MSHSDLEHAERTLPYVHRINKTALIRATSQSISSLKAGSVYFLLNKRPVDQTIGSENVAK